MTPEQSAALRAPFAPEAIGKLPKVWCRACTDANKTRRGTTCSEHTKTKCGVCGNTLTTAHLDLDYVGHAAATDRLLQVDPEWTWEPVAVDPQTGAPLLTDGGLWVRLTVAGVTRLGYGDGDSIKVMIGDAIRNAAMRFGVALDLWSKEDLQAGGDVDAATDRDMPPSGEAGPSGAAGTRRADRQQSPADALPAASTSSQGRATPRETTRTDPAPGAAVPPAAAAAPEPVGAVDGQVKAGQGASETHPATAPPAVPKHRIQQIESRNAALIAAKVSISAEREKAGLRKTNAPDFSEEDERGWLEMLDRLERETAPFVASAS